VPGGWARIARLAGPPPRATCPASTVEDRERDAVRLAGARDRLLRPVQRPVGREIAAVLVAVRIADHHHLLAPARIEMRPVDGQREELREDTGRCLEVLERLEERHDQQARFAPGPPREEEHGEEVGRAARHRHDERAE
jgi:hypothetical protein